MQEKTTPNNKAYKVPEGYFNQLELQLNAIPGNHETPLLKTGTITKGILAFAIAAATLTLLILSYQSSVSKTDQLSNDLFALDFIETDDLIEYSLTNPEALNEAPQSDQLIISYLLDENVELATISDAFQN